MHSGRERMCRSNDVRKTESCRHLYVLVSEVSCGSSTTFALLPG